MFLLGGDHGFQLVLEVFEVSDQFVLVLMLLLRDQQLVEVQGLLTPGRGGRGREGGREDFCELILEATEHTLCKQLVEGIR